MIVQPPRNTMRRSGSLPSLISVEMRCVSVTSTCSISFPSRRLVR